MTQRCIPWCSGPALQWCLWGHWVSQELPQWMFSFLQKHCQEKCRSVIYTASMRRKSAVKSVEKTNKQTKQLLKRKSEFLFCPTTYQLLTSQTLSQFFCMHTAAGSLVVQMQTGGIDQVRNIRKAADSYLWCRSLSMMASSKKPQSQEEEVLEQTQQEKTSEAAKLLWDVAVDHAGELWRAGAD